MAADSGSSPAIDRRLIALATKAAFDAHCYAWKKDDSSHTYRTDHVYPRDALVSFDECQHGHCKLVRDLVPVPPAPSGAPISEEDRRRHALGHTDTCAGGSYVCYCRYAEALENTEESLEFNEHYERCLTAIAEAANVQLDGSELQWSHATNAVVAKLVAPAPQPELHAAVIAQELRSWAGLIRLNVTSKSALNQIADDLAVNAAALCGVAIPAPSGAPDRFGELLHETAALVGVETRHMSSVFHMVRAIRDALKVAAPAPSAPQSRLAFLPAQLVIDRNRTEGLTTVAEALIDASHVQIWNKNQIRFDVFEIVFTPPDRYGWVVRDVHPRWNLAAASGLSPSAETQQGK